MWFVGIIWSLAWLAILWWWIPRSRLFRLQGVEPRTIQWIFIFKVAAGVALWAIYTWYYPYRISSDTYGYFDDAMVLHHYLTKEPSVWFRFFFGIDTESQELAHVRHQLVRWSSSYNYGMPNDNQTIIRINMLIALLSQGVYHIHTLAFSLISLIGSIWFIRGVRSFFASKTSISLRYLLIGVTLLPSVLFWSSGVLKEAPMIAAFGALVLSLGVALRRGSWHWLWVIPALAAGMVIKPYVFIAAVPGVIALFVASRFTRYRWGIFVTIIIGCYFLAADAGSFFAAGDMLYILGKKQQDFYNVATVNDAGSAVSIPPVSQDVVGFLLQAPERTAYALFRPWPPDYRGVFYVLPIAESLFVILAFLLTLVILIRKKIPLSRHEVSIPEPDSLWWPFVMSFILIYAIILGSTVPVLGALVRYKIPILVMVGVSMSLLFQRKSEASC